MSLVASLPPAEPDKILKIMAEYAADPRPDKIDLGVGVYRDADGQTPIMAAVKVAEYRVYEEQETKVYTDLRGDAGYLDALGGLVFGPSWPERARLARAATAGGSGAVRSCFEILRLARPDATVWVCDPSWPNHVGMLTGMARPWRPFPYYNPETWGVDRTAILDSLSQVPAGDAVLLHGCCHNPTGADLDLDLWQTLADLFCDRGIVPIVDLAYQGFGDGIAADTAGLRRMAETVPELLLAVSGAKTFGLYRERVGAVFVLCPQTSAVATVNGTLAWINRQVYAFPPDHGARAVTEVLTDLELRGVWAAELDSMRARIQSNRQSLAQALHAETGSDRYAPLAQHRGMFSRLPASPEQVRALREAHGVYVIGDGRMNIAGLSEEDIPAVARAISAVLG